MKSSSIFLQAYEPGERRQALRRASRSDPSACADAPSGLGHTSNYHLAMALRWLTGELYEGDLTEDEYLARFADWQTHHDEIRPRLSGGADRLLGVNIHDARIRAWSMTPEERNLTLTVAGETPDWKQKLTTTLTYREATIDAVGPDALTAVLDSDRTELLYQEIEIVPGGYEQSLLVWRGTPQPLSPRRRRRGPLCSELIIRFTEVDVDEQRDTRP